MISGRSSIFQAANQAVFQAKRSLIAGKKKPDCRQKEA
jgi:hypothetical protein